MLQVVVGTCATLIWFACDPGSESGEIDPDCPAAGGCQEEFCSPCGWNCGSSSLCAEAKFSSENTQATPPFMVDDMAAVTCILEALRDGTPGQVTWRADGMFPGMYGKRRVVDILPNRVGLVTEYETRDGNEDGAMDGPFELKDASYFDSCLGSSSADALWTCLEGWSSGSCVP